ncbi:hypothetical protein [Chengkuizengella marina]|uniref:Uncharacterized protein n=1 Tax=Chengkuizengella marina TaxID=2507566 RepID=A0A6N9Q0P6_9BACL|nr:hypothetical protein [Chengkuizengella marina]NBI28495.1 hypothetical protein [Chengkuizengella marina]
MGHFDKTKCDCCVCPMQCVLEQFINEEVIILTNFPGPAVIQIKINKVENFIVSGLDIADNNIAHVSICNIVTATIVTTRKLPDVKPIQQNTKGECVCCEDPITNVANSLLGKPICITGGVGCDIVIIVKVGEGIVIAEDITKRNVVFSSCALSIIKEVSEVSSLRTRRKSLEKTQE